MKALQKFALSFGLMVGALALLNFFPAVAGATSLININDNPEAVSAATGGQTSLRGAVLTFTNYALGFLGLLAVIMIIYGGVQLIGSAGNEEGLANAKKIITYAVIGIVIVLLSFVIVQAVLGAGTGVEV